MRKSFLVAAVATLAFGVTGVAHAQEPRPRRSTSRFSAEQGGHQVSKPKATKLVLTITNSEASKTTASKLEDHAPRASKLSTKDFTKCDVRRPRSSRRSGASAAALKARPDAHGERASSGVNGTKPSPVAFEVTPFASARTQMLFLPELKGGNITYVATGKISGRTLTVTIPGPGPAAAGRRLQRRSSTSRPTLSVKKRQERSVQLTDCPSRTRSKVQEQGHVRERIRPRRPCPRTRRRTRRDACS